MANITITQKDKDIYHVTVAEGGSTTQHKVTLTDAYHKKFSGGAISKENLIKKSFVFLLEREPKEAILSEFNLSVIQNYFPEYKETIL